MSQDITALPQHVRDFIQRQGFSLNPICWENRYQYPKDAHSFTPEPHRNQLHFFVLDGGGQCSMLHRHDRLKRGIVYECGPREAHIVTRPGKPIANRNRAAPVLTADITDTLPTGKPGVDDFTNPKYFAQLEYYYPDKHTRVQTHYLITTATETFEGELKGSTGKLSLFGPAQIRYQVGTPVTAEQWQQTHDTLQQACELLSEQRRKAEPFKDWPRAVQPLHLINTKILHPGDPKGMDAALFNPDGHPLVPLFHIAREIWERPCQRLDQFVECFCRWQEMDKPTLSRQLGQSVGACDINIPMVGRCMVDLIYLQAHEDWLQPLKAIARRLHYSKPDHWTREAALIALLSYHSTQRPQAQAGNRSPYFDTLQQIGQQLHQLARLQRQQDKVFTQTEQHNCLVRKTLKVPEIGANWYYQPSTNLSKPKRILRLGLFFDGTDQNRYNDERLPDRDISNVAKMQDLYHEQTIDRAYEIVTSRKIYIPGVGTITGHETQDGFKAEEDNIGLGFGIGKEGGQARIAYALDQMHGLFSEGDYEEIIFDVFGFSRGAALARHFVNMVNQWKVEYRPYGVLTAVDAFPQHLTGQVAFVGLWDTVGSFYWPGNDRQGEFNLNLNEYSAGQVVHLVAAHEVRHNFPSTRITDAHKHLPANFTETVIPGVHADVGGGYENPTPGAATSFDDWRDFYHVVEVYEAGWDSIRVRQLQQRIERRGHTVMMRGTDVYELTPIYKELSIYPLRQMYDLAKAAGVPLRDINPHDKAYTIPADLAWVYRNWQNQGADLDRANIYLKDYIHTSERGFFDVVNTPGILFKHRQVFPNRPQSAIEPRKQNVHA